MTGEIITAKRITVKKFIADYEQAKVATAARKPAGKKNLAVASTTKQKSVSVKSSAKKKRGCASATTSTKKSASRISLSA